MSFFWLLFHNLKNTPSFNNVIKYVITCTADGFQNIKKLNYFVERKYILHILKKHLN